MGTFYLGLSMAGTVSAGTYTGGTLSEINHWLSAFQTAKAEGLSLKASANTKKYKIGDTIRLEPTEIPDHEVKIKTLAGASGGGVSAALMITGWSIGQVEDLLKNVWTSFDVKDMLCNDDLSNHKPIYSVLNVKPIDKLMNDLLAKQWGEKSNAQTLNYLDDNIEIFMTLASYEGIPYKTTPTKSTGVSYGVHKTHLDYIKFNFSKNGTDAPPKPTLPFANNLVFRADHSLNDDNDWKQFILSCPATAAFPVEFKPRSLKRYRKEYVGKLFYLNYTISSATLDYSTLQPAWPGDNNDLNPFDMEYIDGGTFNRDPHDLARASLIESLNSEGKLKGKELPHDGKNAMACVILVDPFPSNFDSQKLPGTVVVGIPTLINQPQYILGAMI